MRNALGNDMKPSNSRTLWPVDLAREHALSTQAVRNYEDLGALAAIQSQDPVKQEEVLGNGKAEVIMANVYRSFFTADSLSKFGPHPLRWMGPSCLTVQ
jgi:hypothetical protein